MPQRRSKEAKPTEHSSYVQRQSSTAASPNLSLSMRKRKLISNLKFAPRPKQGRACACSVLLRLLEYLSTLSEGALVHPAAQ